MTPKPTVCKFCAADDRYLERVGRQWTCACCGKAWPVGQA